MGHQVQVIPAALGEKAGAIGAAYHSILENSRLEPQTGTKVQN
jgi:hypothetical protein